MQAPPEPPALLALQALQVQSAQLALWDQWVLLGQVAWLALLAPLVPPARVETPAQRALREAPARQARLVRRGVSVEQARLGLRVL